MRRDVAGADGCCIAAVAVATGPAHAPAHFHLLVSLRVFNTEQMNQAVFAFRRYEDASLRYTGIESHPNLRHVGLYDTVVAIA